MICGVPESESKSVREAFSPEKSVWTGFSICHAPEAPGTPRFLLGSFLLFCASLPGDEFGQEKNFAFSPFFLCTADT